MSFVEVNQKRKKRDKAENKITCKNSWTREIIFTFIIVRTTTF